MSRYSTSKVENIQTVGYIRYINSSIEPATLIHVKAGSANEPYSLMWTVKKLKKVALYSPGIMVL